MEESMDRSLDAVHANKILDVLAGVRTANSGLASWRRSGHLHALDPANRAPSRRLTQGEVAAAQERLGRLLGVAQCTLDRLFLAVGRAGCSVLLADGGGLVVDRRGAVADDATFDAWGLWTGALWSERFEGTMCAQYPDRLIALCDGGGRILEKTSSARPSILAVERN
jgi:transcriptional regulator of acetoin/glycerol metabolism